MRHQIIDQPRPTLVDNPNVGIDIEQIGEVLTRDRKDAVLGESAERGISALAQDPSFVLERINIHGTDDAERPKPGYSVLGTSGLDPYALNQERTFLTAPGLVGNCLTMDQRGSSDQTIVFWTPHRALVPQRGGSAIPLPSSGGVLEGKWRYAGGSIRTETPSAIGGLSCIGESGIREISLVSFLFAFLHISSVARRSPGSRIDT